MGEDLVVKLLFHALMVAADLLVLRWARGGRWWRLAVLLPVMVVLPWALTQRHFFPVALFAAGFFVHLPIVLLLFAGQSRRGRPRQAQAALWLAGAIWLIAADAFLVEPDWLEVTTTQVVSAQVTRPVRIVLVADLQADGFGSHERKALRAVVEANPDLVLFSGDYFQTSGAAKGGNDALAVLAREFLRAEGFAPSLGAVAVEGDVDPGWGWEGFFRGLPVEATRTTRSYRFGEVVVTALSRTDSMNASLRLAAQPGFHVVVGHRPDYFLGEVEADLLLAGHVHGGQVALPFIGPLITASKVPRAWAVGRTNLLDGRILYTSRGIGMERGDAPRLRFLARPEVAILDIVPG